MGTILRLRPAAAAAVLAAALAAAPPSAAAGRPRPPAADGGAPLHLVAPARTSGAAVVPPAVLAAYRRAAAVLAVTQPVCRLRWPLLAGIGEVESDQAFGGDLTPDGRTRHPILGPPLDGRHGRPAVRNPDGSWARARGPMQFLPATWAVWGADADGDGLADPDDMADSALTAGAYLCADARDLDDRADLRRAVLSYNPSAAYLADVLAWARRYAEAAAGGPGGRR